MADRILASKMGYHAVNSERAGVNRLVSIRNNQITDCDIEEGMAMQRVLIQIFIGNVQDLINLDVWPWISSIVIAVSKGHIYSFQHLN